MLEWFCFIALLANSGAMGLALDDEILKFTFDGFEHNELRKVDGNIVTVTDVMDGFLVTLDYERDLLMIKNLTTQTCYFSRLENIPVQKGDKTALMVKEVTTDADLGGRQHGVDEVLFSPVGTVPSSYVLLTNDVTVAEACVSQPAYWMEMKAATRQRRDCDIWCGLGVLALGIGTGIIIAG